MWVGGLWSDYSNLLAFVIENAVIAALIGCYDELLDGLRNIAKSIVPMRAPQSVNEGEIPDDEELGILDYQEIISGSLDLATHSVSKIRKSTTWIGEEV